MEPSSTTERQGSMRYFTWTVLLAQLLGLVAVIMVAVWMGHYRGGFSWQEDLGKQFNYHPLFMIIGMVFLYGDAILVYRVFRNDKKVYIKVLHAVMHVFALIFAAVGLKAVFDSHNLATPPKPNMYTLHSWIGLTTVVLFGLQWVFGFVTFLAPGLNQTIRAFYKPYHVYWGVVVFVMAIATALMGITEKALWAVKDNYALFVPETYVVNFLGVILVSLGITVVFIVTNGNFERQASPDEERLQLVK